MAKSYWLLKTEPGTFRYAQLEKEGRTNWNGVRNFQARNFLKQAAVGDMALIYHSGEDKAVVGLAQVTRAAYPDVDPEKTGDWVQIDLAPVRAFSSPVALREIKSTAKLKDLLLIKQSRLSVMPVSAPHFEILCQMGDSL